MPRMRAAIPQGRTVVRASRRYSPWSGNSREGDEPPVCWPIEVWPSTVTDVLARGTVGYRNRVEQWASSPIETLAQAGV